VQRLIIAVEEAPLYPYERLSHICLRRVHAMEILEETLVLLLHLFRSQLIRVCHNIVPL